MKHKLYRVLIGMFILAILAAVVIIPTQRAQASNCVSDGSTADWILSTTWSGCGGTGVPVAGDNVTITKNVTNGQGTIVSLTINSGGSLKLGGGLNVTGQTSTLTLDLSGDIDLNNQILTLSYDGNTNIKVCGTRTIKDTSTSGGGFFTIYNANTTTSEKTVVACTPGGGTLEFSDTTIVDVQAASGTGHNSWFDPGNGLTTIYGTLRVSQYGSVVDYSPTYGTNYGSGGSVPKLQYNYIGSTITAGKEWVPGANQPGVPYKVELYGANTKVQLSAVTGPFTILGDVFIDSSAQIYVIYCNTCDLSLRGNLATKSGQPIYAPDNKMIFEGSDMQMIGADWEGQSSADFTILGSLEIKNSNGVLLGTKITINQLLIMSSGNLDIDQFDLTLSNSADSFIEYCLTCTPSSTQMIIADNGSLCKYYGTSTSSRGPYTMLYPIGDGDVFNTDTDVPPDSVGNNDYSPFTLTLPQESSPYNYRNYLVCVKVIDEKHPHISSQVVSYLSRYWHIYRVGGSSNLPTSEQFTGLFQYVDPGDVVGTESTIYGARYDLNNNAYNTWELYSAVNASTNQFSITDNMLTDGDYTGLASPTAVSMANMQTLPSPGQVLVQWSTGLELNTAGFNVYRSTAPDGPRTLLNSAVIDSKAPGEVGGADYEFTDTTAQAGVTYYYWIEALETGGGSAFFGPLQTLLPYFIHLPLLRH